MKKIDHLEDLAFVCSQKEIQDMMGALIFNVNGSHVGHMGIKYDGTCLVFGKEADGRFFLSDQGYFNKTPRKFYSADEIFEHPKMPEQKAAKLVRAFDILSRYKYLMDGMTYYADWLFDSWSLEDDSAFQPNIIRYSIRGRFDRNTKLGIALHTQNFCGAGPTPSTHHVLMNDVFCAPTSLTEFSRLPMPDYHSLFDYMTAIAPTNFSNPGNVVNMRKSLNAIVRANDNYNVRQLDQFIDNFEDNTHRNLDILIRFKYKLLHYLNSVMEETKIFETSIDGEPTSHEGFVFHYLGRSVKLVDRYKFSKKNFDPKVNRGWQLGEVRRINQCA